MGEMWNALSDAEKLPYEQAAKEATRLQYERVANTSVSDPTLGSLTAAPTTTTVSTTTPKFMTPYFLLNSSTTLAACGSCRSSWTGHWRI